MAPVSLGRMWNHLGEGIVGLLSKNLLNKGLMVGDLTGVEKKEFIHVVLAEANTKRRDGGGQRVAVLSRMVLPRRTGGWCSKARTPQRHVGFHIDRVCRAESQGTVG